ncbi:MAG: DUF192 domain-containing protein [Candidatus Competibacteraceae bacterium]|nr:DUF192 domain-containing protein [Candidatus Competibacteraceae bacterium]
MPHYRRGVRPLFWLTALIAGPVFALDPAQVTVGPATFQVEIAQTPQDRQRGLMFRRELPREMGMLFIQPLGPAVFWMKNTYIPLDLLYFNADQRLLQILADVPPCVAPTCPIYPSQTATVRYILEINAGEAARRGIQVGDRLQVTTESSLLLSPQPAEE